ncbi:MAG: class I SAM-dependent methyltransferase [Patescibacteria group bacterium]
MNINSIEEYLEPNYYKQLLKDYSFNGVSDTEYLRDFLSQKHAKNILELGCGSGRATDIALKVFPNTPITLVDLSERMIAHTKKRFLKIKNISFIIKDAIFYLRDTTGQYDLVYSLWSFSHSVHHHIHRLGFEKASMVVYDTLLKFVRKNLIQGGELFIIHFDSLSPEQRILMRQWKRVFREFSDITQQSPSKRMLDKIFLEMDNHNEVALSVQHLLGDPIKYKSLEELLEVFMNFHLESFFNKGKLTLKVLRDITEQVQKYRQNDGSYIINSGCYIYKFIKL